MKIKTILSSTLAVSLMAIGLTACVSAKQEQAQLQARAKVSQIEAEKTALGKAPGGKVESSELEEEGGRLVWSFDITTPGSGNITEVLVDARTGAIVSVDNETPEQQAKEKKQDANGKK